MYIIPQEAVFGCVYEYVTVVCDRHIIRQSSTPHHCRRCQWGQSCISMYHSAMQLFPVSDVSLSANQLICHTHTHTHIERQTDRQTHIHVSETYKSIHKSCHFQHDCSTRVQSCIGHEDVVCASGTSCCTSHRINIYLYNKLIRIGLWAWGFRDILFGMTAIIDIYDEKSSVRRINCVFYCSILWFDI